MEIDTQIVAINPIPPQDGTLPRREEKEPERKENEVEEQECKLGEHDMKALADLLEAIGENELPFFNPEPQTTSTTASTSVAAWTDSIPMEEAQIHATPVAIDAIIPACATPACVSETQTYAYPTAIIPYQPAVEPISPIKIKKGLKVKTPGFKKHRSFPSLPPYKGNSSRESPV